MAQRSFPWGGCFPEWLEVMIRHFIALLVLPLIWILLLVQLSPSVLLGKGMTRVTKVATRCVERVTIKI